MGKRLRWMVIGAAIGIASKRKADRQIDQMVAKAPAPLQQIVNDSAVVARIPATAWSAAVPVVRVGIPLAKASIPVAKAGVGVTRRIQIQLHRAAARQRHAAAARGDELRAGIEQERRRLKSEQQRHLRGDRAATDALLDLRLPTPAPLPVIPAPISPGRRRHQAAPPAPQVARVQRSYRPPSGELPPARYRARRD